MILILDNYDSFTYNLVQYVGTINSDLKIIRNDKITVDGVKALKPSHVILSPGPGFPKDAGICVELVKSLKNEFPVLGVCLGHQSIGEAFGGNIVHAPRLMHGKQSRINIDTSCPVFYNMPYKITGARYHSLVVEKKSLPSSLKAVAWDEDGEIMGLCHKKQPIFGVQFHPESMLTDNGVKIIENFLNFKGECVS